MAAMMWIGLLTLPLVPVYPTPTYVGCFDSIFVRSDDFFRAPLSLPSVECLGLCDHRLTRYAGIQSLPTYDYCFCGNELLERSTRVDNSTCVPCSDVSMICGSNKTVALYKLRGSTPVAVLLATENGVELFKENATTVIVSQNTPVTWLDFSYADDTIFLRVNNTISRSSYSYLMVKHIKPVITYDTGNTRLDDLAVDWIRKKLFFVYYYPDVIIEMDYDGSNRRNVFDNDHIIRDLQVDPYFGALFFVDISEPLHSFVLQSDTVSHYYNTKLHYDNALRIALDIHKQLVFMVVRLDGNSPLYLLSTAYGDAKTPTMVFNGPELTDSRGLDVFNGDVYWVNYKDQRFSMYRCRLTPRCQPDNLIMMYQSTDVINDIRVFHPYKQTQYHERMQIEPERESRSDEPTTVVGGLSSVSSPPSSQPTTTAKNYESSTYLEVTTTSIGQLSNEDKMDGSSIYYLLIVIIIGILVLITLTVFGLVTIYVKLTRRIKLSRQPVSFRSIPSEHVDSTNTYVEITDFRAKPCSQLE